MQNNPTSVNCVLDLCIEKTEEYRIQIIQLRSTAISSQKCREAASTYEAKAQALEELVESIKNLADHGLKISDDDINKQARTLNPELFNNIDLQIQKWRAKGWDEGHILNETSRIYGPARKAAFKQARDDLANWEKPITDSDGYERGLSDAIGWHEKNALLSENMAAKEKNELRKTAFFQRSARHKLYASTLRKEFGRKNQTDTSRDVLPPDYEPAKPENIVTMEQIINQGKITS